MAENLDKSIDKVDKVDKGTDTRNTSANSLNTSFTASSSNPNFEFLPSDISSAQPHIITIFNKILNSDKIFFNWTAKNKDDKLINGVSIYESKLKTPSINKTFLKNKVYDLLFRLNKSI